ncbi:MAG: potassium channel protein [Gemmatimonadetes bacterium]|nr:MAG: potassium channel protein [Gemmatimonadota bacterium]
MNIFVRIIKKILPKGGFYRPKLLTVLLVSVGLNVAFGIAFYFAERHLQEGLTLTDAIWWAMVTMTTVGYGDIYAQTAVGRFLISYPCMVIGIGIIGYLVGIVAESVLESISRQKKGLKAITMKDHIIICNCPQVEKVVRLVDELSYDPTGKDRQFVLITERFEELPEALHHANIKFVKGDPTKEDVLQRANILKCAGVFVLAENPSDVASDHKTFAIGTIIEMIEKEHQVPIKTVVELVTKENLKMMQRTHVDGIVSVDGIINCLMVQEFLDPGIHDVVHELISNKTGSEFYTLTTRLTGFTVGDIQKATCDAPQNVQLIGVIRHGEHLLNPEKQFKIEDGDRLVILAPQRTDFERIEQKMLGY